MPTALVTGATAGIGREFVRQFAEQGYDIVAVARTGSRLAEIAAETESRYGVRVEEEVADLVLSHAAATTMKERGSGRIINVSSVASFISAGSYSAAKAFVTVFTEGLSTELAGTGVTATALCPGFTHTEFHERGEMDVSYLPEAAWLDAREVVAAAIADSRAGKAVSVPSARYKAVVGLVRVTPRGLLRNRFITPRHRR